MKQLSTLLFILSLSLLSGVVSVSKHKVVTPDFSATGTSVVVIIA